MATLYRVIVPVADIEVATAFYTQLLAVAGERVSPGRHYFDCDGVILACYDPVADGDGGDHKWRKHPNEFVYFAVDDLEGVSARGRRAGARDVTPIEEMPWGERLFYLRDPFGNGLSFVQRGSEFRGTPPEEG